MDRLPNALILGDSISLGYTPAVKKKLAGQANVSRPGCNCGPSQFYLRSMRGWVGTNHWDVIHVNFGIWDNHYLKGPSDGMGLYWGRGLTTPLTGWEKDDRCGRIRVYNELAADVCKELGVAVDDLYAVADSIRKSVGGQPFWNANARFFMYPPAFDFPEDGEAVRYAFEIVDAKGRMTVLKAKAKGWLYAQPAFQNGCPPTDLRMESATA